MSNVRGKGQCRSCHIRHLSIFAQLPEQKLIDIQSFQPLVMGYDPTETIYHQGANASTAYTLRKGLVKLLKVLPNGRTQIVRVIREGELFGFDGFAGDTYNHTAIPLTEIEVCRLPLAELLDLKRQNPEIENAIRGLGAEVPDENQLVPTLVKLLSKKG